MNNKYDYVIVGAGSTGAVIASRLSEDPGCRVLLLEAGADYAQLDALPEALRNPDALVLNGHHWRINALIREESHLQTLRSAGSAFVHAQTDDRNRLARNVISGNAGMSLIKTFDYSVGKVVGGSSAINGAVALRGMPEDYDEWRLFSQDEWSWDRVLPYFLALEDTCDLTGPLRGRGGPVPIKVEKRENLTKLQRAFVQACKARGYQDIPDHNDSGACGVGVIPKNVRDGRRMSTAITHLAPARHRKNLTIISHAHVRRLSWRTSNVCGGVEAEIDGDLHYFDADRVVVCAGTLNTPPILMRSGIGSPADLRAVGIDPRVSLPGVGRNLIDHSALVIWGVPKSGVSVLNEPIHQAMLRYGSVGGANRNDMHIHMLGGTNPDLFPVLRLAIDSPIIAGLAVCLMKPLSRGSVGLSDADPKSSPHVVVNCLQRTEDLARLKEGVRRAWELIRNQALSDCFERLFIWTPAIIESEGALERTILTFARPQWHAVGTARMGLPDDSEAVVDAYGKVYGVDNLWVGDASIMPTIPSAPTNLTCIMMAERIAHELRKQ
ncbi:MAG TPA: GMC family oxidoreductase [Burkholderiales bacterium]|nr:GMC family oxidoreductase [Burkholderiales bacterium]